MSALIGPVPTLIEWDSELPPWAVLKAQMMQALDVQHSMRGGAPSALQTVQANQAMQAIQPLRAAEVSDVL